MFRLFQHGSDVDRMAYVDVHSTVFVLAVRLLRGETIEHVDQNGTQWRASATALLLVEPETGLTAAIVLEADAFDVAHRLAHLG